jgi:resuscitation-promoting factor RpfA
MSDRRVGRAVLRVVLLALAVLGIPLLVSQPATADPSADAWARLRMCEASGSYTVVASHGHYGAYQFDLSTWRSVGGTGYPHQASPAEQDYRALYLYRMRGWQPWTCARKLGLADDGDARSKRVPSYTDSAYMGGGGAPGGPTGPPPWPGKVYVYGDCDPALSAWQLRMNVYGYDFQGTGCYYAETQRAVLDLQRKHGINPSGKLGPQTWAAAWA